MTKVYCSLPDGRRLTFKTLDEMNKFLEEDEKKQKKEEKKAARRAAKDCDDSAFKKKPCLCRNGVRGKHCCDYHVKEENK